MTTDVASLNRTKLSESELARDTYEQGTGILTCVEYSGVCYSGVKQGKGLKIAPDKRPQIPIVIPEPGENFHVWHQALRRRRRRRRRQPPISAVLCRADVGLSHCTAGCNTQATSTGSNWAQNKMICPPAVIRELLRPALSNIKNPTLGNSGRSLPVITAGMISRTLLGKMEEARKISWKFLSGRDQR